MKTNQSLHRKTAFIFSLCLCSSSLLAFQFSKELSPKNHGFGQHLVKEAMSLKEEKLSIQDQQALLPSFFNARNAASAHLGQKPLNTPHDNQIMIESKFLLVGTNSFLGFSSRNDVLTTRAGLGLEAVYALKSNHLIGANIGYSIENQKLSDTERDRTGITNLDLFYNFLWQCKCMKAMESVTRYISPAARLIASLGAGTQKYTQEQLNLNFEQKLRSISVRSQLGFMIHPCDLFYIAVFTNFLSWSNQGYYDDFNEEYDYDSKYGVSLNKHTTNVSAYINLDAFKNHE